MLMKFMEVELDEDGIPLPEKRRLNLRYFVGGRGNDDESANVADTTTKNTSSCKVQLKKNLKSLKISRLNHTMMNHQGKYPTIYLDFKELCGYGYMGMQTKMKKLVADLFKRHKYLKKNLGRYKLEEFRLINACKLDNSLIGYSVRFLSRLLRAHFNRSVCIFVEDYDAPVKSLFVTIFRDWQKRYPTMTDEQLFSRIFGSARFRRAYLFLWTLLEKMFKENDALHRGFMTGVFDLKFANAMAGGLTNVSRYSLQDKEYDEYYGFTEPEVRNLLKKSLGGGAKSSGEQSQFDIDAVRNWYGYNISGRIAYNCRTIRHFIGTGGSYRVYFQNDHRYSLADYLLQSDAMQETLHRLDNRRLITRPISRSIEFEHLFRWSYSYLSFSGYFNFSSYGFGIIGISVPNREIETVLRRKMIEWLNGKLGIRADDFRSMYESLADFEVKSFQRTLEKFLPSAVTITPQCCNGIIRCLTHVFERDYLVDMQIGSEISNVTLIARPTTTDDDGDRSLTICTVR